MATATDSLGDGSAGLDVTKKAVMGYIHDLTDTFEAHQDGDVEHDDMYSVSEKICNLCISFTTECAENKSVPTTSSHSHPPRALNPYHSTIASAYALLMAAVLDRTHSDWQFQGEKQGVFKYRKDAADGGVALFRGEKVLDLPRNVLLHALQSKETKMALGAPILAECGVLEIVDEHCSVQFEHFKAPVPFTSPRDIVYVKQQQLLPDGTVLSFGSSVEHPARPRSDRFCRANLKIGGWAFKPVPNNPGRTQVYYVAQLDLAGYVPSWLMNRIAAEIPMTIERFNQYLLSHPNLDQFNMPFSSDPNVGVDADANGYGDAEVEAGARVQVHDEEHDQDEAALIRKDSAETQETTSDDDRGASGSEEDVEDEVESEGTGEDVSWTGEHMAPNSGWF